MTQDQWIMLGCLATGWLNGIYLGWVLWRRPHLKYPEFESKP